MIFVLFFWVILLIIKKLRVFHQYISKQRQKMSVNYIHYNNNQININIDKTAVGTERRNEKGMKKERIQYTQVKSK